MFVECRKCDWEQDDFWSKEYNPLTGFDLKEEIGELLSMDLDDKRPHCSNYDNAPTYREYLSDILISRGNLIKNMKWRTLQEFKEDKNKVCPKCGSDQLSID